MTATKTKRKKYDILSPDGFSINAVGYFTSVKKAKEGFDLWLKRYEEQGYYSSRGERIPLVDVVDYCRLIEVQ